MNPLRIPSILHTLRLPSRKTVLAAFAFATAVGLLLFVYRYLEDAAFGDYDELVPRLIDEMTAAYAGVLLVAIPIVIARRFPVGVAPWTTLVAAHVGGVAVLSATHTTLNYALRSALYPLAGHGAYDYGFMPVRYFMELPHDVIVYTIVVGFVHLFDHYRRTRDREVETARLEARLSEARLKALRLQIQPHFLFNALNTISSLVYDDPRAADEMLAKLSEFLRLTLDGSASHVVPLHEEIAFLDLYLDIIRARFGDRLDVRIEVDDAVQSASVPQLLLQPIVENAVKHGIDPETGAMVVAIMARREGNRLVLVVRDHGPGLDDTRAAPTGRGIGLLNTADRLRQLYGDDHALDFNAADGGGLAVTVEVPYSELRAPAALS